MADDINEVILIGRLTRDMELQYTNTGWAIGKMSIAVNKRKKSGETWEDRANFFDVSLFGKRAESLAQYLLKGTQIAVTGNLNQNRWEQDGSKRSRVVIEASGIQLLGSKSDSHSSPGNSEKQQTSNEGNQPKKERFEDDIPF
ncbi:MAG: single-stranded DNA-binding protein [Spirochaetaceae bacterium]|jgi:single-strand DNA-binding protein|nr:single-stranded DNA-binding protein [Spirochaetaceae bacterium]